LQFLNLLSVPVCDDLNELLEVIRARQSSPNPVPKGVDNMEGVNIIRNGFIAAPFPSLLFFFSLLFSHNASSHPNIFSLVASK
jgi:hypothetical protein